MHDFDPMPVWLDVSDLDSLADIPEPAAFAAAWLRLQCRMMTGLRQGVVVIAAAGDSAFQPIAVWPEPLRIESDLEEVAELALRQRRGVIRRHADAHSGDWHALALPLIFEHEVGGVVAFRSAHCRDDELPIRMRQLQWGSAWLEWRLQSLGASAGARMSGMRDLVTAALHPPGLPAAAQAVARRLADDLNCEQVAIGFFGGLHIRLCALARTPDFEAVSTSVKGLAAAMEEAVDQRTPIVFPEPPERSPRIVRAHSAWVERQGTGTLCTLPLAEGGHPIGALTLERAAGRSFRADELVLFERLAALIGPLLAAKRRDDRRIGFKLIESARNGLAARLGVRLLWLKLAALGFLGLLILSTFIQGEYRVRASATLEGIIQRSVAASVDGHVATSTVRVGDIVEAGELLVTLDDSDLRLEQRRLDGERHMLERQYSESLARDDRASVRRLVARLTQNAARRTLLEQQLAETRIRAPFSGLLISGDLTRSLGSPVSQGQVLFQIAPIGAYRVRLMVDEQDLPNLRVGQAGRLSLRGLSMPPMPIHVTKITAISRPLKGRNVFDVESLLDETPADLRPGMAGIAKIDIARRRLIWIWTHRFVHWARRGLWLWWG